MLQVAGQHRIERAVARERAGDALSPEFLLEWQGLADNASEPSAFAEHWFLIPALAHFGAGRVKLIEIRSLDGVLAGLIPLHIHDRYGRIPVRHVRNWVHYQCYMGTPLVRAGAEAAFWTALLGWLDGNAWARGLLTIGELEEDGPLHRALAATRHAAIVHRYERAILRSGRDAESYLEDTLRAKKRKEMRRLANRLADCGAVAFATLDNAGQLAAWTSEFLALEASGWKGERGAALGNAPETATFLAEAVSGAFAAGRLDFQRLSLDGRAIAMLINFRTPPGSWSFKIAYDEALARFSPGVMIEIENLKRVLADPEIDWMDSCAVADHPMIDRLWAERRSIVQVTVPLSGSRRRLIHALCRSAERGSAALRRWRAA
jgi:CelD/BcsL family acetyltransferase involved in cellulose biosynthesis